MWGIELTVMYWMASISSDYAFLLIRTGFR